MKVFVASMLVTSTEGHGSMSHPRPRNAYSVNSKSASSDGDKSCVGDACYWYQIGCHIGCPTCTLTGKSLYPGPHCTEAEGLMEPTNNDPEFRTWDPHGDSECGDFTKYNPWRAPGKAPVADPCGIASGAAHPTPYAAVPQGYQGGQKGSEVLPAQEPTYWKAGGVAQVGWGLSAQHGGGYIYRLCPKNSTITESCFQSNTLQFTAKNSTIHFDDDSHGDISIPTKTYIAPDGSHWRTNPIPGCACDSGLPKSCGGQKFNESRAPGQHDHGSDLLGTCTGINHHVYEHHGSPTTDCPVGTMFEAGFDQFTQGFLVGPGNKFSVMDEVHVPNTLGEFVLGWRWDCEETDQVWNSCADIVITDGPTPAPTPAPPSPSPSGNDYVCHDLGQGPQCFNKPGSGTMSKDRCYATCKGPPGKNDYLCWKGKCYNKPGFGQYNKTTCEEQCSSADDIVV